MIHIILLFALTGAQQSQHDAAELAMYQKLQAFQRVIDDIWRPTPEVLSAQRAARRCYTDFHLYKVDSCDREFSDAAHALKLDLVEEKAKQ